MQGGDSELTVAPPIWLSGPVVRQAAAPVVRPRGPEIPPDVCYKSAKEKVAKAAAAKKAASQRPSLPPAVQKPAPAPVPATLTKEQRRKVSEDSIVIFKAISAAMKTPGQTELASNWSRVATVPNLPADLWIG